MRVILSRLQNTGKNIQISGTMKRSGLPALFPQRLWNGEIDLFRNTARPQLLFSESWRRKDRRRRCYSWITENPNIAI